jgi:hypothetical protein
MKNFGGFGAAGGDVIEVTVTSVAAIGGFAVLLPPGFRKPATIRCCYRLRVIAP